MQETIGLMRRVEALVRENSIQVAAGKRAAEAGRPDAGRCAGQGPSFLDTFFPAKAR